MTFVGADTESVLSDDEAAFLRDFAPGGHDETTRGAKSVAADDGGGASDPVTHAPAPGKPVPWKTIAMGGAAAVAIAFALYLAVRR